MKPYLKELTEHRDLVCEACPTRWVEEQIDALALIMWGYESEGKPRGRVIDRAHERYELQFPVCKSHRASYPRLSAPEFTGLSTVDNFYANLPIEKTEDELFDTLGFYSPPEKVVGAVVALCWGKLQRSARQGVGSVQDLSRVVMIHELAHLVSHLGGRGGHNNFDYWKEFEACHNLREIVAQMATEERIEKLNQEKEPSLHDTFEALLKNQRGCYTAHREIINKAVFKLGKSRDEVRKLFWSGFLSRRNTPWATKDARKIAMFWIIEKSMLQDAEKEAGMNVDF
jgi:hypothetical protein